MYGKPLMYVVKINDILSIENADNIELAKVMDYSVIVKKGEFIPGDLAVYVEVGSLLPNGLDGTDDIRANELTSKLKTMELGSTEYNIVKAELTELTAKSKYPYFEFLRQRKFKIKAMKMRGVISQGILFKPNDIGQDYVAEGLDLTTQFNVTESVQDTEEAGIIQANISKDSWLLRKLMRFEWYRNWRKHRIDNKTWDPSWPSKSDEINVQQVFSEMKRNYSDKEWVATEKLEGQNLTVYSYMSKRLFYKKKAIGVCSRTRNISTKDDSGRLFWATVKNLHLDEKIKAIPGEWFCRGEHVGPGIQKNIYKLPQTEIYFFDFYQKINGKFIKLNYEESCEFAKKYDLPFVPVLDEHYKLPETAQEMLVQADKKTIFGNDLTHKREGFVLRLRDDYNVSFKVKNPFYSI